MSYDVQPLPVDPSGALPSELGSIDPLVTLFPRILTVDLRSSHPRPDCVHPRISSVHTSWQRTVPAGQLVEDDACATAVACGDRSLAVLGGE